MDGEIIGSVFVVQSRETVAKLRLLLVEPKARGLGLGTRLVEECIRFARRRGYQKLMLWTNSILLEARHIYEKTGFHLVAEEAHHSFGKTFIEKTGNLVLEQAAPFSTPPNQSSPWGQTPFPPLPQGMA